MRETLGAWMTESDGGKKVLIKSTPSVELDCFGIDDPGALSKLQGPQYACVWLEEPAPIIEKANAGLPKSVFDIALARAARQRETVPRVQVTQNPADDEHWTALLADDPRVYAVGEDGTEIIKEVFRIPKGENKHLKPVARAALVAAFKDDKAKYQRYVEGEEAAVYLGQAVTPGYDYRVQYAKNILPVFPGEGLQFWDGWMHPSCILAQWRRVDSSGTQQLVIHDVLVKEDVGTAELIEDLVEPMLRSPKWKDKITKWRVIGDPSMKNRDQTSSRSSAAKYIEDYFDTKFERGPVKWAVRREPLNRALRLRFNRGVPAILLSRSATRLHRAFKGAWSYKTDNNNRVIGDTPIQNSSAAHPGNAASYGIAVLFPYRRKKQVDRAKDLQRARNRISSYSGRPVSVPVRQTPGMR